MEWTNDLKEKPVCLDTIPVIYFIEEIQTYLDAVKPLFETMGPGRLQLSIQMF